VLIPRHEKFVSAGVADGGQRDGETFLMEKATNIDSFDNEDLDAKIAVLNIGVPRVRRAIHAIKFTERSVGKVLVLRPERYLYKLY
jgi:hypothetical protein